MAKVICDPKRIFNRTGIDVVKGTISGNLFRDCRLKTFMILTDDESVYIAGDSLDRGDFEYRAKNVDKMVFSNTYLTYEGANGHRKKDETSNFIESFSTLLSNDETLELPGDMAADSYLALTETFRTVDCFKLEGGEEFCLYSRTLTSVLEQIHENDELIHSRALSLFAKERSRRLLEPYVRDAQDTRFESLNAYLKAKNLSALIFSSPLNVQEVAALNFDEIRRKGIAAFYNAEGNKIYIVSKGELEFKKGVTLEKSGLTWKEAFCGLDISGGVGIEEESIPIAELKGLELSGKKTVPFSKVLREWREGRSGEDLAYYIIAARLTAYAIDGAKEWAEEQYYSDRRFTENEIFEEYNRLKYEFIKRYDIPVQLETYDPCVYSSDRSEYCCTNTEFLIPSSAGSVRIDNGELVKDKYGYVQATSDIARTVCFNPAVRRASEFLLQVMREQIIPNIRAGMKYSEIWEMGTKPIFESQNMLKAMDMIPEKIDLYDLYKRNIGHGMSKQTRTANFITEDNDNILKECSVGNIELPFNFRKNMVAVEDMWFCTPEGTVNITVD